MTKNWSQQLPMYATYSRIVLAPCLMLVLYLNFKYSGLVATILFVVASLTDWLDGYWARKYNAESPMGKFMDPIADKIIVLAALIMLLYKNDVDPIMVFILLARDIFIGGIRAVAATNQVVIAAKPFGKWKTAIQMVAIPCMFINEIFTLPLGLWGYWALWVSVILSLISGVEYTWGYYTGRQERK